MCVNVFVNGLLSLTKRYIYSQFTLLLFCLMMFVVCLFVSSLPLIIVHFLYLLISWIKSREKPYRQLSKYDRNNLLLFFVSRGVLFAPFDTSLCLFSSCLASMSCLHVSLHLFPHVSLLERVRSVESRPQWTVRGKKRQAENSKQQKERHEWQETNEWGEKRRMDGKRRQSKNLPVHSSKV